MAANNLDTPATRYGPWAAVAAVQLGIWRRAVKNATPRLRRGESQQTA